jgi:RNA polymerase sigma-70 factor (ECF subfamily)
MEKGRFEGHAMELQRYAARMLGSSADAEDVVQNALLKAHRAPDTPDDPRAWLYAVVRHEVIDHLRRRRSRQEARAELAAAAVAVAEPPQVAETADLLERVTRAVAGLAEPYREVIVLRFQHGLKFEQVARIVDAPVGTVKVQAARGLKLLRERLGRLEP